MKLARFAPLIILVILSLGLQSDLAYAKSRKAAAKPYSPRYASIVVEADSGMVLSQENADWQLYPASLTKLMTLLLTFDALSSGKLSLNSPVYMSAKANQMPPSKLDVKVGQSITVEQAIKALVTKSANNVAVALAERVGGSESSFVYRMNLKSRELGMSNTHFENASGWHNVRQVSSARDMARLGLYILHHYPTYYRYFALKNFYFNGANLANHNKLMATYRGMDGMKTGYVYASGFNLVASAKRDGVRLVGVVFGGKTASSRNSQMAKLLDAGFEKYKTVRRSGQAIASLGQQGLKTLERSAAPVPSAPASAASGPVVPLRKNSSPLANPPAAPVSADTPSSSRGFKTMSVTPSPETVSPSSPYGGNMAATDSARNWQIQIGAFQDRSATDSALYKAQAKLPAHLKIGTPLVAPLRTSDSQWVFRARFSGYTRSEALEACRVLGGCLTIAPTAAQ